MEMTGKRICLLLFLLVFIIIAGVWTVQNGNFRTTSVPNTTAQYTPVDFISPTPVYTCTEYHSSIPAEGDVFLGESRLNVSSAISSGEFVSWYNNNHTPGVGSPDSRRLVRDARCFFVNPDEYLGFEGKWYVGSTGTVAFVVRKVILDFRPENKTPGQSGIFDEGVLAMLNSTNRIDSVRTWVELEEPPGIQREHGLNLTPEERILFRERQRAGYLNYTKPIVDYVRTRGYVVDYIGQTTPVIEVFAPPPFLEELAQQPCVRKIGVPKTTHPLIKEMLQRQPDDTLDISVTFTKPPGVTQMPDNGSFTEARMTAYYSENRAVFRNHTLSILDPLKKMNASVRYLGPYPATGFWADVPVYLIEEYNSRPEVSSMDREIPAYLV